MAGLSFGDGVEVKRPCVGVARNRSEKYKEQQKLSIKRYVIYSHDEDPDKPQSVLACFDDISNGVVYDMNGTERLKYNQSEGKVIDPKIGTPGYWKWHLLNEPPDLQYGFIDTQPKKPSPELEKIMKRHRQKPLNVQFLDTTKKPDSIQLIDDPMMSIELMNIEKSEAAVVKEKYKPIKIKLKSVKINEFFSLRLSEQANINVIFRDGDKHLKLNLGMLLVSNTIIGLNMVDPFDVVTPYTNTRSAQFGLSNIKNKEKMREKLEAVRPRNEDIQQFELKRDLYNIVDADASKTYASSFKVIRLR